MLDKIPHRNCHRIILILLHAFLEWILILLLFLNSFFSFLVTKFVDHFGLEPCCTLCSRLDHIWGSKGLSNFPLGHVCEVHGAAISGLSYCFSHCRLTVAASSCDDCLFSRTARDGMTDDIPAQDGFLAWVSESGAEYGEPRRCSCCDKVIPSKKVYGCADNKLSIAEVIDAGTDGEEASVTVTDQSNSDRMKRDGSQRISFVCNDREWSDEDESVYITDMLLQNADYADSDRFICIELTTKDIKPSPGRLGDVEEEHEDKKLALLDQDHLVEAALLSTNGTEMTGSDTGTTDVTLLSAVEKGKVEAEGIEEQDGILEYDQEVESSGCSRGIHESVQKLHEELIHNEKAESRMEDSFEGSVVSEMEGERDSFTMENLKFKVKAQEKALNALYTELNEERKAAAVAANETIAMITKLQEERAAMQMEALQYQQMMEEQAEYDQEALQLLNDLMMKREREKQELEKQLEMCRIKVSDYEARENISAARRRNKSCSLGPGESNGSDTIDLHLEDDTGSNICGKLNFDEVLEEESAECITHSIDISLAEFDGERLSIIEELKALEAKLVDNAADVEFSEEMSIVVVREELSHAYERLQALEADKEFLRHCISSMMKGTEGLPLLLEILQHLRGLRSVEFLSRSFDENPLENVLLWPKE